VRVDAALEKIIGVLRLTFLFASEEEGSLRMTGIFS